MDFTGRRADARRQTARRRAARVYLRAAIRRAPASATAINYTPGLNVGRDGKRFFDGLLLDDPAAGTWYPVVMKDGKDVLLTTAADKAAFVPQIDVAHQMLATSGRRQHPDWMSYSYLENKRNNARILRDKGITNYRICEVRGVSHSGGESMPDGVQRGDLQIIDVSKADGPLHRHARRVGRQGHRRRRPTHSDDPSSATRPRRHDRHPALAFPRSPARSASTPTTPRRVRARRRSPRSPARASSRSTARTSAST